ncbi:uncharacterized protein METZ01_LOCUS196578 [marine metagenome]|uniref:C1q domain-containing protein n=1 Tax=marine metagenome TaxID=408172 RepID=A0A382E0P4_9ZZZZ
MPNVEIDGTNSTVKTNVLTSQSASAITVPTGKVLTVTDAAGLTVAGSTVGALDTAATSSAVATAATAAAQYAIATQVPPSTSGKVLTSDGTNWTSATPVAGGVDGITSSANTTAMTISADEEINMPLQPVFAHTTANTSDNQDVTGDGTLYTILFNTQKFDIGSNTNANGVFTAPITGVYLFGYHLEIVDGTHNKDYDYIYLDTGGFDPGSQHHFSSVSIDLHERVQMTFLVQMTAGWTAIPRIARHSGTKDSDIRGGSSHFWGVLIA